MPSRGIIFYTDSQLDERIARPVREQLLEMDLPIVSVSLEPLDFGENIVLPLKRGYLTMFKQILTALEASTADVVYFCEHDVLYHPSHFDFVPESPQTFYYNQHWWKVRKDGLAVSWEADQVSGLSCYRELAIEWYKKRIVTYDEENFDRKFEPLSGEGSASWKSEYPNIDIRHNHNLTYNKWSLDDFRKKETAVNFRTSTIDQIPGWDSLAQLV